MVELDLITLPDIPADTTPNGRFYHTAGGVYPSITTVLGVLPKPELDAWRKNIGAEAADKITRQAGNRGSRLHEICEDYVLGRMKKANQYLPDQYERFLNLRATIDANLEKVIAVEAPLYSDYLGIAGRTDLIGVWNGRTSIIDYKTSRRVKTVDDISGYLMQCAAYAIMFEERTGMPVSGEVILMMVDDQPDPLVFQERRNAWVKPLIETIRMAYAIRPNLWVDKPKCL
jgi:CRISPR/Cas system-associated exonuclease Cas4 (RecB family)